MVREGREGVEREEEKVLDDNVRRCEGGRYDRGGFLDARPREIDVE